METITTTNDPHLSEKDEVTVMSGDFDNSNRVLSRKDPRQEYTKHKGEFRALHWGQRKLLLSEIEFLTIYGDLADLVVYVGAAGGYHIPLLSSMFPRHVFDLYDPAEFAIKETKKINIYRKPMSADLAQVYSGRNLLLISDIRTVGDKDPNYGAAIRSDNAMQLEWAQIMKPKQSMFKFKLPYDDESTEYPKGPNYLPIWGRPDTTETRLVFDDPESLRSYSHRKHEEQMAYFNNNTLLSYYPHDYEGDDAPIGVDHCYSCRSELHVLEQYYLKVMGSPIGDSSPLSRLLVKQLSERISREIAPNKSFTLATYINKYEQ